MKNKTILLIALLSVGFTTQANIFSRLTKLVLPILNGTKRIPRVKTALERQRELKEMCVSRAVKEHMEYVFGLGFNPYTRETGIIEKLGREISKDKALHIRGEFNSRYAGINGSYARWLREVKGSEKLSPKKLEEFFKYRGLQSAYTPTDPNITQFSSEEAVRVMDHVTNKESRPFQHKEYLNNLGIIKELNCLPYRNDHEIRWYKEQNKKIIAAHLTAGKYLKI